MNKKEMYRISEANLLIRRVTRLTRIAYLNLDRNTIGSILALEIENILETIARLTITLEKESQQQVLNHLSTKLIDDAYQDQRTFLNMPVKDQDMKLGISAGGLEEVISILSEILNCHYE
jgi:hypothetical protein